MSSNRDLTEKNAVLAETSHGSTKTHWISLPGKKPIPLSDILDHDQIQKHLKTLGAPLLIGDQINDQLPNYINRSLTDHLIAFCYLQDVERYGNLVLICSDLDFPQVLENIPNICKSSSGKCQEKSCSRIYFCRKSERKRYFDKICQENAGKTCHCFEFGAENTLKWLESNESIEDLLAFQQKETSAIPEEKLDLKEYPINILCDESGMGKSWFLKSLQINHFPGTFVVYIEPKKHEFFGENPKNHVEFEDFLQSIAFNAKNELEAMVFQNLYLNNRIVILWDSLDEVPKEWMPSIFEAVDFFKKQGLHQWLASRNRLKEKLENRFTVLSRNLSRLERQDQEKYIKKRLELEKSEEILQYQCILDKLEESWYSNELFGIPLQLFMITELIQKNPESNILTQLSENRLFSIARLYQDFLANKLPKPEEESYEKAAMQQFFNVVTLLEIDVSCDEFLDNFKTGDGTGIITSKTGKTLHFAHFSFAEFLAAQYLTKNHKNLASLDTLLSGKKLINVRYFFDALNAQNSELHLAILHRNVGKVKRLEKILDCKDALGRNPLDFMYWLDKSDQFMRDVLEMYDCHTIYEALDEIRIALQQTY